MEYIRVTKENLEKEHICCAISNNKDIQVSSKKAWLADRFDEVLVFLKSVERGYVLYYTNQCPFNAKYVPILEETAQKNGIPFKAVKIESRKDAKNVPTPITTYALFCDGEYVTNEQMNDKKFLKLVGREEKTTWHQQKNI